MVCWIAGIAFFLGFMVVWGMCYSSGEADDQAQDDIIFLMRRRQRLKDEKSV